MKKIKFIFLFSFFVSGCIDGINIAIPDSYTSQLVVDGLITDEPGPYTVRLTKATRIEKFLQFSQEKVQPAHVTIFDNEGTSELLTEVEPGVYQTKANAANAG